MTIVPRERVSAIRETFRHPDLTAIKARVPVLRDDVPMRAFWSRRPVRPARMLQHAREAIAGRMPSASVAERVQPTAATVVERVQPTAAAIAERVQPTAAAVLERLEPVVAQRASKIADAALRTRSAGTASLVKATKRSRAEIARVAPIVGTRVKDGGRQLAGRAPKNRWMTLLMAIFAGVTVMYYADPQSGRRRRARVRDRLAHARRLLTRNVPRAASRRGRFIRGKMVGVRHEVQELAAVGVHRAASDNETLVARVRSEVLGHAHAIRAGDIHVDAYEGLVTLRGQVSDRGDIERLVNATRHVDGVNEVRSYLHVPGTLPPNKAQAYEANGNGSLPSYLAR